jgi:hypothetical protein
MVSFKHEGLVQLVRDCPAFAADLLARLLGVELPAFRSTRLDDSTLARLTALPHHPDAVVLFGREPVFGAIVEAQLTRDHSKRYTWPLYATAARAKHRCRFAVVVIAPDRGIARWSARTVDVGGGIHYQPLVVGPERIPKVTDFGEAQRQPRLSMLSVMTYGGGEVATAVAIAKAASRAIPMFPRDQQMLYSQLIHESLSEEARKVFKMDPWYVKFLAEGRRRDRAEGKAEGKAEGRAEGKAQALLMILQQRGLPVSAAQQKAILVCTDGATLERWLKRALAVKSTAELLPQPARVRTRRVVLRTRAAPAGRLRRRKAR